MVLGSARVKEREVASSPSSSSTIRGVVMSNEMMRAVRFHEYGSPQVLRLEEVPRPQAQKGQVLVRVHAAGVNPIDWKMRRGGRETPLPAVPGIEFAGIVDSVGPDVTSPEPGREIFGVGRGTYAEYTAAAADSVAAKPRNVSFNEAASIPIGARTAWAALFDQAKLEKGQRLLVHGAAGGVGLWAVQFGRWKEAEVIGTASAANLEFIRSLGADTAIDYRATRFEDAVRDVDVILDTVGGETQDRSWKVIRPGGMLVTIVGPAPEEAAREHGVRTARIAPQPGIGPLLHRIGDMVESGIVKPHLQRVFPLDEVREAHTLCEQGHGRGRIVLHVSD
jgi:NADPH:quinone reductase-like Zn-dependent oxidoreductase